MKRDLNRSAREACDDDAWEVKNAILSIALSGDEDYDAHHPPQKPSTKGSHVGLGTVENLGGMDPALDPSNLTNTHRNIDDEDE